MENRPIHRSLDTSFVNLSALIRYLRRRQFIGNVRVEMCGYEADVVLTADGQMKVLEHDCIAGRISEGEDALQRLLIRAREPGGIIHVYQKIEETESLSEPAESAIIEQNIRAEINLPVVERIAALSHRNGNSKISTAVAGEVLTAESDSGLLKFPFEKNNFEPNIRPAAFAPTDWQTLLNLTAELLRTVDNLLIEANLDFSSAFEKARVEIAADYPFLNPSAGIFNYRNGKLIVREQVNIKFFAASINEILRRMLEKLGRNPKYSNIHRILTDRISFLVEHRKPLYDKFSITPSLEKIIRAS